LCRWTNPSAGPWSMLPKCLGPGPNAQGSRSPGPRAGGRTGGRTGGRADRRAEIILKKMSNSKRRAAEFCTKRPAQQLPSIFLMLFREKKSFAFLHVWISGSKCRLRSSPFFDGNRQRFVNRCSGLCITSYRILKGVSAAPKVNSNPQRNSWFLETRH